MIFEMYQRFFSKAHTDKDKNHSTSIHTVKNLLILKNKYIKYFV